MKILIAPDSFKESLSALEAADFIEQGILNCNVEVSCIKIPLADGGEGTVAVVLKATGGQKIKIRVKDPLFRDIESYWGLLPDRTAILEMAAASGLELLEPRERNPLLTTTFGTGQLIKSALDYGCRKIYIGIGGSATNDGGTGMARALGARFLDENGQDIPEGGRGLATLEKIDMQDFDARIADCEMIVISDVRNPMCGPNGASRIFAPQKGADPEMIEQLEHNLLHFGSILEVFYNKKIVNIPGTGAAGGLGAGLLAFCDARMTKGFDTISNIIGLDKYIEEADLVITGEGKLDKQTRFGKVPFGVAQKSLKHGKPVIGIAGTLGEGYQDLYDQGFNSIFSICEGPETPEYCFKNAGELLKNASERIFRLILLDN